MKFECTECGQHLEVETIHSGREVECPTCGKTVVIPEGYGVQHPTANAQQPTSSQEEADPRTMVQSLWGDAVHDGDRPEMTLKGESMRGRGSGAAGERLSRAIKVRPKDIAQKGSTAEVPEYEILRLLGEGGMGIVYEARQTSIDRNIAIKMIKPNAAKDEDECHQFLAEAVATADLDHPNIVPVHDLGKNADGALFYAMKQVKGTSWLDLFREKSVDENLDILMRVADAVAFAHNRGVIHRDLKPENVMLGDFGEVLVMDWGLAAAVTAEAKADRLDPDHAIGGTPCYMAPEMAVGDAAKIGYASDIYLLGAILFEIVTGEQPHAGTDVMDCLANAAENEIVETDAEGELLDIALKAMAKQLDERFETVKAFQTAVREYQQHEESIALSTRARQGLVTAKAKKNYRGFARCVVQLEEAVSLWSENHAAVEGLSAGRLAYAECALQKGDLDLAASILDAGDSSHRALSERIYAAQKERTARRKRAKALKTTAVVSAVAAALVFAIAFFFVRAGERRAVRAEREAIAQKDIAQQALAAESEAKQEVARQRDKAEEARKAAEVARHKAETARESEEKQRRLAEAEGYRAKIGMAAAKMDRGQTRSAESILDSVPEPLRNWEWGRLKFRCHTHRLSFEGHRDLVAGAALSPDGKLLATASYDRTIRIWDVGTGKQVRAIKDAHGYRAVDVTWSPDGKNLATSGWDGTAKIWDATTGRAILTLRVQDVDVVDSVSYSPDGRRLATSAADGVVRIWDLRTGQEELALRGHTEGRRIITVAFSPDGTKLVSTSFDHTARLWDVQTGKSITLLKGYDGRVGPAAFSPDGTLVATGARHARIWRVSSGKLLHVLKGHDRSIGAIAFSPDGTRMLTGSIDYTARVWDVESGEAKLLVRGQGDTVNGAVFAKDGRTFILTGGGGYVKAWDAFADSEVTTCLSNDSLSSAAFSPDGKRIVTSSRDHKAYVWDTRTRERILRLVGHKTWVYDAKFSPGGDTILTGSDTARLWNAASGELIRTLDTHAGKVWAVAFFADGKQALTAGEDKTARLWDPRTGRAIHVLEGHTRSVHAVAASPNGRLVATGSEDRTARIWDAATGKELRCLGGHNGRVTCVTFSADSRRIATSSYDHRARLFDVGTGRQLAQFEGHTYRVASVVFSNDGRRIATAGWDSTIKVWETQSGQEILTLEGHLGPVLGVDFSPNGLRLATASSDNTAMIWTAVPWTGGDGE